MKPNTLISPVPTPREASLVCIACGTRAWTPKYETLLQCRSCGFITAGLDIDEDALRELYSEGYFRGEVYADYLAERAVHQKNSARRYEVMRSVAGDLGSVFEIGCAYGLWLEFLSSRGVVAAGVDICSETVSYARDSLGQNAVSGDFLRLEILPETYQTFVMWDTIEHLANPELFVERIVELLPTGGWLFVTTGDIGSRNAKRRRARWRLIQPPIHLQYFSRATISRLFSRYGLDVRIIESEPVFRNLRGTLANLTVLGKGFASRIAGVATALTPEYAQEKIGFWVDLGDIMFVGAQKRAQ